MSGNTILLDTNAVSALFRRDQILRKVLLQFERLGLPVVVLGELHYGAQGSSRRFDTELQINEVQRICEVYPIDGEIAVRYAAIRFRLRQLGRPIPDNDVWIAAIALHHDLPLLSRDAHFRQVEGLDFRIW